MNREQLTEALKDLPVGDIYYFDRVTSTNDYGFEKSSENAPDMTVITAFEQVQGRGRMQRQWITVPGTSLPMTIIIRPTAAEMEWLNLFSPLTGLAVHEALRVSYHTDSRIKWPNDVLLNGKKISGILCETQWQGDQLHALILGIGINLLHGSAPEMPDLNYPASSIEDETGIRIPPQEWIHNFLEQLIRLRPMLRQPEFFSLWESCLAYRNESVLLVRQDGSKEQAIVREIAPDGSLITENDTGEKTAWLAGEISLRRI